MTYVPAPRRQSIFAVSPGLSSLDQDPEQEVCGEIEGILNCVVKDSINMKYMSGNHVMQG